MTEEQQPKKVAMEVQGSVQVQADVEMVLRSPKVETGRILTLERTINLKDTIMTKGKELMCKGTGGDTAGAGTPAAKYIALGTSAVAVTGTQTKLYGEFTGAGRRILGSFVYPAGSSYYRLYRTFQAGTCTGAIVEWGMFNKQGAGTPATMLNRGTFPVINKGASDTLQVTGRVTFT